MVIFKLCGPVFSFYEISNGRSLRQEILLKGQGWYYAELTGTP